MKSASNQRRPPSPESLGQVKEMLSTCSQWLRRNQSQVVLTQLPLRLPTRIHATPHQGAPLREAMRPSPSPGLYLWPKAGLSSSRYPVLVFVMEGEADLRVGVTERMARGLKGAGRKHQAYTLQIAQSDVLLMPAGVPVSNGSYRSHWERPRLEEAYSQLLWFTFLEQGVTLNTCVTRGEKHANSNCWFVTNARFLQVAETLIESVQNAQGVFQEAEYSLLLSLVLLIERSCRPDDGTFSIWTEIPNLHTTDASRSRTIERAVQYIETHIRGPLTVELLAAHAFVSPTQLNRLFRIEFQTSVMAYVLQKRMELARTLLGKTEISVSEVSNAVGYPHPNYFSQAFAREVGVSPTQYRLGASKQPSEL